MAIMIPGLALDYDKTSKEDIVYDALKKHLPDDWYVCHSFKIKDVDNKNQSYEAEIDFLILVPDVGAVCLECKAGRVNLITGEGLKYNGFDTNYLWVYADGTPMKYNGPFRQLDRSRRIIIKYLEEGRASKYGYNQKINFLGMVCFPSLDSNSLNSWKLPSDAGNIKYILSKEEILDHPETLKNKILQAIEYQISVEYTNKVNKDGVYPVYLRPSKDICESFIKDVIAPFCNLVPSSRFFVDLQNGRLKSFLNDQINVLNYLEEQKIAVISGGAGTGKTMIAIEKALRLSSEGEKVLYLCYNAKLKEKLEKDYKDYPLIKFENIDSLYVHYMGTLENKNYNLLVKKIDEDKTFDYKNFMIDEAQDFGKSEIESSGFLLNLQLKAEEHEGFCYFFYDKHQLVQSSVTPEVINNADCKLSLFRNCRNTDKIAKSSCTLFTEKEFKKKHIKGFEEGNEVLAICSEVENNYATVSKIFSEFRKRNYKDIVILTAKDLESSSLNELIKNEKITIGGYPCPITTCRKFKGLEAEAVIIVDIDNSIVLDDENRLLFYVGASRAKFELGLIFNLSTEDAKSTMRKYGCNLPLRKNSFDTFYAFFSAEDGE